VEIYQTFETEAEAFEKEIELIEKYGRKCFGAGTLINLDKGGVDPTRQKVINDKEVHIRTKPVYVYNANTGNFLKKFNSINTAEEELEIGHTTIFRAIKEGSRVKTFLLFKEKMGESCQPKTHKVVRIDGMDDPFVSLISPVGEAIKKFPSVLSASVFTGMKTESIARSLKKGKPVKLGKYKGYIWKYGA
jgi:hypothetical protein